MLQIAALKVKSLSNLVKKCHALLIFQMVDPCSSADSESVSSVTVELSRESLDTILDGLGRIRDQLSVVAGKWSLKAQRQCFDFYSVMLMCLDYHLCLTTACVPTLPQYKSQDEICWNYFHPCWVSALRISPVMKVNWDIRSHVLSRPVGKLVYLELDITHQI